MKTELTAKEPLKTPPVIWRYGVAVLSVAVALAMAKLLQIQYGFERFAVLLFAMMFSAWFGGVNPGLLALALSLFAFHYFFLIPIYPLGVAKEIPRLLVATLASFLVVWLSAAQRSATDSLRRTNESLRAEIAERKRAEQALKQPDDHLRFILDTTPAMIHTGRPDGYLDHFNRRWLDYVGLPLEGRQGWAWRSVVLPEDIEGETSRWRACIASGEPFEYEARVRRADGKYRWMLHRKVAIRDEHGNIVKWCGSAI